MPHLIQDNIFNTLKTLSSRYTITFDIKPYGLVTETSNILHVTIGGNVGQYGDRYPSIFFHPKSTKLKVCTGIGNNDNYQIDTVTLPMYEWSSIKLAQQDVDGKLTFMVFVNDKQEESVVNNNDVEDFHEMTVYLTDKWYPHAKAFVRNLKIFNH